MATSEDEQMHLENFLSSLLAVRVITWIVRKVLEKLNYEEKGNGDALI